jgi:hypothetical protein
MRKGVKMSLNTKTYSKLLRETAKQNGVELLEGRWTDGLGPRRTTTTKDRVVTFRINMNTGNFYKFYDELSSMSFLKSGTAPRYSIPRSYYRRDHDGRHTYVKFNCEIA